MGSSAPAIQYQELKEFIDEFKAETDRAAVILGAAKLDLLLYQLIQGVLLPSTSKNDELLDGDSPLGTFSSRISIAHRLGLIDDSFCKALNLIRRIRNSFAHELKGAKLATSSHKDRVRELVSAVKDDPSFEWLMGHFFNSEPSPDQHFRCVVALACVRLEGACNKAQKLNLATQSLLPKGFKVPSTGKGAAKNVSRRSAKKG